MHSDNDNKVKVEHLERELAEIKAKVDELEQAMKEIERKLEYNELEVPSLDKRKDNIETEVEEDGFSCNLCNFKSSWKNGLVVHKGKKHKAIEQLDGNITLELEADEEEDEDTPYQNTKSYWHKKVLGRSFQNYLDASKIIEESSFNSEEKKIEMAALLEARKEAFGDEYKYYPPWR